MESLFKDDDFVPFEDDELDFDLEALATYEDDEYDSFEALRAFSDEAEIEEAASQEEDEFLGYFYHDEED